MSTCRAGKLSIEMLLIFAGLSAKRMKMQGLPQKGI